MSLMNMISGTPNLVGVNNAQNAATAGTSGTLGLSSSGAPAAAAPSDAASATGAAQSQTLPDGSSAGGQAAAGAEAVQPPDAKKIIMGSVLRGAMTGGTMLFSLNKFLPPGTLHKALGFLPFLFKPQTAAAVEAGAAVAAEGAGAVVATAAKTFIMPTLVALGAGAVIGAVFGFVTGTRKAKKAVTDYAEQQAKAQAAQQAAAAQTLQGAPGAPATGDPLVVGPNGQPQAVDPTSNVPATPPAAAAPKPKKKAKVKKNPVMGPDYAGSTPAPKKRPVQSSEGSSSGGGNYHIHSGDTLGAIARRYHTSVSAIQAANADKITNVNMIYAGDSIVVPGASGNSESDSLPMRSRHHVAHHVVAHHAAAHEVSKEAAGKAEHKPAHKAKPKVANC